MRRLIAAMLLAGAGVPARADVIDGQDFNGFADVGHVLEQVGNGGTLGGAGTMSGGGPGLGFSTRWLDTDKIGAGPSASLASPFDIDRIGINGDGGNLAPDVAPDGTPVGAGERNFELNDADGTLELVFDGVDMSGFENRSVSLHVWVSDVAYAPDEDWVAGIDGLTLGTFCNPVGDPATECQTFGLPDDGTANWFHLVFGLDSIFDALVSAGSSSTIDFADVTLRVRFTSRADDQSIFVDNILFTGDPLDCGVGGPGCDDPTEMPEPASGLLLALGALALGGLGVARRCGQIL